MIAALLCWLSSHDVRVVVTPLHPGGAHTCRRCDKVLHVMPVKVGQHGHIRA